MTDKDSADQFGNTMAYVSVSEAAEIVGVSEKTVRRWIWSGHLESVRLSDGGPQGAPIRIESGELRRFLTERAARRVVKAVR